MFSILVGMSGRPTLSGVAQADIYVYHDTQGTMHFTNVPGLPGYQAVQPPLSALSRSSQPGIYLYRDARGIAHFTNVPYHPGDTAARRVRPRKETTQFDPLIRKACQRHGVEFALVKAVIKAESAFDPLARSSAGAQGLMQLMPTTAAMHGVTNVYTPRENINGGVRHLRLLLDRFRGNLKLTLAAYNAGSRAVKRYNGIPPYKETQQYVRRVLRYRDSYRQVG